MRKKKKDPLRFVFIIVFLLLCFILVGPFEAFGDAQNLKPSRTVRVELNKSSLLKLEEDATRVSIANPKIASVTLITPRQILIVSQESIGVTNMIVWHGDERISAYDVEIYIHSNILNLIKRDLAKYAPDAKVTPSLANRSLILDGYVNDQEERERVLKIAGSYVSEVTSLLRVSYTIQKAINESSPDACVTVTTKENGIILDGAVKDQETLMRVLQVAGGFSSSITNLIRVKGPQQIQLEVSIDEVSRSGIRQMGLSYLTQWKNGTMGLYQTGLAGQASDYSPNTNNLSVSEMWATKILNVFSGADITSTYGAAFQALISSSNGQWSSIVTLLKGQGLARTLASPTLVTLNGQRAEFLVGGEIPYLTNEQIVFRDFGIQLEFTPFVTGEETITLRVRPTVSTPDWSFDPPGLKRRNAEATLRLKDGQTFVMAGLLTEDFATITNKVPFLGDIPILGALFTSKQFRKEETELMITVTPRLVRPLNACEVKPLPGEGVLKGGSDVEFFLLNDTCLAGKPGSRMPAYYGQIGFER